MFDLNDNFIMNQMKTKQILSTFLIAIVVCQPQQKPGSFKLLQPTAIYPKQKPGSFPLNLPTASQQTTALPPRPSNQTFYCSNYPSKQFPLNLSQVCGIRPKGLPQTFPSPLSACKTPSIFSFKQGSCQSRLGKCWPGYRRSNCMVVAVAYVKSCGFEAGMPPRNISNNLCCTGTSYTHWIVGECPVIKPKRCRRSRPRYCYDSYEPVCVREGNGEEKTYRNRCLACWNTSVTEYYIGECFKLVI